MKKTWIVLCALMFVLGIAANGHALIWDNLEGVIDVGSTVPGSPGNQDDYAWVQGKIDDYNFLTDPDLPDLFPTDTGEKEEFDPSLMQLEFDPTWLGTYAYISFKAANELHLYYIADVVYPPLSVDVASGEFYGWWFQRPELSHYTLWQGEPTEVAPRADKCANR